MVDKVLQGGDKLFKTLDDIANKMEGEVTVGFLAGATYPDGTPVAAVAFWNEFGVPSRSQPARPFFRKMIAAESPTWGSKLAKAAKFTNYNGREMLALMGEDIKGALQASINNLQSPVLAGSTVAAKGFAKPLIDTGHMLNSIDYKVDE